MGVAFLAALAAPTSAMGAWNQPVGGPSPINQGSDKLAQEARVTSAGGVPFVAWRELDGTNDDLRVAMLNGAGTAWTQPWTGVSATSGGINQNDAKNADMPDITAIRGVPYVAWREEDAGSEANTDIRVAGLSGNTWQQVSTDATSSDGGVNLSEVENGFDPSISQFNGAPAVAWAEIDSTPPPGSPNDEIRVALLSSGQWSQQPWGFNLTSGGINVDTTKNAFAPSLADINSIPYVAFVESANSRFQLRVKKLGSGAWSEVVPGSLNHSTTNNALEPSLANVGGTPYVAWREDTGTKDQIRVKRLNAAGTAWEEPWASGSNGGINLSIFQGARHPMIASIGGVPYVSWTEEDAPTATSHDQLRVARLNAAGTAWEQVVSGASPINESAVQSAKDPGLASIGGVPYVSWTELGGASDQARVSRLEPEFTSQTATPSQTGGTLSTDVHTYGIPYPVGFQFGGALENETAPDTTPAGSENATITQEVNGLTPASTFQFRPFATAGVPEPRVFGTTDSFTTLEATPTGTPTGTLADATPPAFTGSAKADPSTFAVDPKGKQETAVKSAAKKGTSFRYTLTEAARVVFTIERKDKGRKVGKKCKKQTASNRKNKRCTRFTRIGAFAQQAVAGKNKKKFSGRIGKKKLAPAKYRASLVATDAAGNKSNAKQIAFRVVR